MNPQQSKGPPDDARKQNPMAQPKSEATPAQPPAAAKPKGLTLRQVIWGALVIFAIPALWEAFAQYSAVRTAQAWQDLYVAVDPLKGEMHVSQLDAHILGWPSFEETKLWRSINGGNELAIPEGDERRPPSNIANISSTVRTYTWSGVVRKFKVHVYLGLGSDLTVEYITGPGKTETQFKMVDEPADIDEMGDEDVE